MLTRHEHREKLIFALYQHLLLHKDLKGCFQNDPEWEENDFCDAVIDDITVNEQKYIDDISTHLVRWTFDRLNLVEQAILLEAVSEIRQGLNDRAVIINEAILFAKDYCDDNSYQYINGVLDNIC